MKSPGQSPNVHGNRTHIYINLYGGLGGGGYEERLLEVA